ncbi:MAG: hypothetical protein ACHP7P_17275, partial [Terriglobales bacterium]
NAETTKVIGTVNIAASQTVGLAAGSQVIGHVILDSGTVTAVTAITNALPAGTNVIGHVILDSGTLTGITNKVAVTTADGDQATLGAKADAKSTATDTTAISAMQVLKEISAMEQAPASRAVTNAGTFATQSAITAASGSIASGAVASGAVASGAFASGSISDGAEVTLGTKADAANSATDTTAITVMSVLKEISKMAQAPASTPVTGTFYQSTQPVSIASMPSTPVTGTFWQTTQPVSGTFWQTTQPVSGTVTANAGTGQFNVTCTAANCPINVAQINGVTPLMGNGVTGTGSLRVTVSSDNSAIPAAGQGATGSAVPAGAQYVGGNGSGNLTGLI